MNRTLLSCAAVVTAAVGVGAGVLGAASAEDCYGLQSYRVCATPNPAGIPSVDPTGGAPIEECVYTGPPPCTPVSVPMPTYSPGTGLPVDFNCYIGDETCGDYLDPDR